MLEAVENHTPDVLVVDEIGTAEEVQTVQEIAMKVQIIATTHARSLSDLVETGNAVSAGLVGGLNKVILSAGEKQADGEAVKTRVERVGAPVFSVCVEISRDGSWIMHPDVGLSVDCCMRELGEQTHVERRVFFSRAGCHHAAKVSCSSRSD